MTRPKQTRNNPKGKRTRDRILNKAAELFADKGFAAVNLRELASACNLSKGALFTHYASKRDIYVACLRKLYSDVLGEYQPLDDKSTTPEQRVEHYMQWICSTMSENRQLCRLTLRIVLDSDRELMEEVVPGAFANLHRNFARVVNDVSPERHPDVLIFFFYSIILLNEELLPLAEVWSPGISDIAGGVKSAPYLEALVENW